MKAKVRRSLDMSKHTQAASESFFLKKKKEIIKFEGKIKTRIC